MFTIGTNGRETFADTRIRLPSSTERRASRCRSPFDFPLQSRLWDHSMLNCLCLSLLAHRRFWATAARMHGGVEFLLFSLCEILSSSLTIVNHCVRPIVNGELSIYNTVIVYHTSCLTYCDCFSWKTCGYEHLVVCTAYDKHRPPSVKRGES